MLIRLLAILETNFKPSKFQRTNEVIQNFDPDGGYVLVGCGPFWGQEYLGDGPENSGDISRIQPTCNPCPCHSVPGENPTNSLKKDLEFVRKLVVVAN